MQNSFLKNEIFHNLHEIRGVPRRHGSRTPPHQGATRPTVSQSLNHSLQYASPQVQTSFRDLDPSEGAMTDPRDMDKIRPLIDLATQKWEESRRTSITTYDLAPLADSRLTAGEAAVSSSDASQESMAI